VLSEVLSSLTPDYAKMLAYAGGAIFVLVAILFVLVVFVGGSKTRIRIMIFAGLGMCCLLAAICSLLYVWHFHARV